MLDVKGIPIMQRYVITLDFWHQQKPLIVLITIKCAGKHTCSFAPAAASSPGSRVAVEPRRQITQVIRRSTKYQMEAGRGKKKNHRPTNPVG